MADFEVKIRSQGQGHPWNLELSWKLFDASNHIYINRKTWCRAALTLAIPLNCARKGQKWPILGHNGRVTQGPWNQRGNSFKSQLYQFFHNFTVYVKGASPFLD